MRGGALLFVKEELERYGEPENERRGLSGMGKRGGRVGKESGHVVIVRLYTAGLKGSAQYRTGAIQGELEVEDE